MPFDFNISEAEGIAYVTARGQVDVRASVEAMGELAKDPKFDPDLKICVDLRDMTYRASLGELRVIAWALGHEKNSYRNKVAVVLSQSTHQRRGKVYARFAKMSGFALQLFQDMGEATEWLHSPT